jgi:hypothetical protein
MCLSFHDKAIHAKKPSSSVPEEYSRKQASYSIAHPKIPESGSRLLSPLKPALSD